MSSTDAPTHTTESIADRKKSRELAEARASGAVAPEVDVKTGAMINPHNPEFITKRPWYLGGSADAGPSLEHQANQKSIEERLELNIAASDAILREERRKIKKKQQLGKFEVNMWVEALKNNKMPYRICQIKRIGKKGTEFDLEYEDGSIERKVKYKSKSSKPRIRMTKTGNRSYEVDASKFGKETFDSKRDKYHGFDVNDKSQIKIIEEKYKEFDNLRRQKRSKEQQHQQARLDAEENHSEEKKNGDDDPKAGTGKHQNSDSDSDYDSDDGSDSDDEFVQRDEDAKTFTSRLARQGGVGGAQMKVTARNLRIREDTAKYLRNLDPNSAYYDPKSRSMRDNPNPEVNPDELQFAGDNFARISGDAVKLAETQLFAWEASEKGVGELHPQANPSQAELLKKQYKSKSANLKSQRKKAVLDKYGGAEYLDGGGGLGSATDNTATTTTNTDPAKAEAERKVRFGTSVTQEVYTSDGRLAKKGGGPGTASNRVPLKSKYEEDVFINGHTKVWGSYFHVGAFRWGYADDHSLMKQSYCTGEDGRKLNDESNTKTYGTGVAGSAELAQAREIYNSISATSDLPSSKKQRVS